MLPWKVLRCRSLELPFPAISRQNTPKGTTKNVVISGKFFIHFLEKKIHKFIYIFQLTENLAKYSEVTKRKISCIQ
jgi:hypothetical protein